MPKLLGDELHWEKQEDVIGLVDVEKGHHHEERQEEVQENESALVREEASRTKMK